MVEMQVQESMIHFPAQIGLDSPSSIYSPAAIPPTSDCGGRGAEMAVDPSPMHGCFAADFAEAGYESQLYAMQQSSPAYPMADFDLKELEDIIGPVMEVDHQHTMAVSGAGSPVRPLETQLRQRASGAQRQTELERSNSMTLQQQPPPRLQHRLSMRVLSSSSSSSPSPSPRQPAGNGSSRTGRLIMSGGTRNQQMRSSKPIFPTESVPLQQAFSLRERPPSASPSRLSTRSDPFDTRSTCTSIGAASDPGYSYSVRSRDSGTGSVCSAPGILDSSSPGEYLDCPGDSATEATATKACMEVEMNVKDVRKIIDLDKKILKMQAERAKLIEKASQSTARVADTSGEKYTGDVMKPHELVRVHLFFVPVGIHMLDEPVFEEANSLLRRIGGKYVDLERAIATLRHICCKGMAVVPDFSTCFAYIKSLLQETQKLQLLENGGLYQIELDSGPHQHPVPQEFTDALGMANRVLRAAQSITHSYHAIQMHLQKVQGMARDRSEACDSLCQNIGLTDRDRRSQIQSVMDGNFAMLSTAVRVWPQYHRAATETIRAITQCIHPSNT